MQVGCHGRTVVVVAADLGGNGHTVTDAVVLCGQPSIEDPDRFGDVDADGLDETLFAREGRFCCQCWSTQITMFAAGSPGDEGGDSGVGGSRRGISRRV